MTKSKIKETIETSYIKYTSIKVFCYYIGMNLINITKNKISVNKVDIVNCILN